MRAIFFGTPAIAVPALDALCDLFEVAVVVCQPDRPAGRGLELRPPAIKLRALERGVPVMQPTKVRTPEFAAELAALGADVALVMAYGRILPKAVLEAPRRGCINLHASLLPKYRGAAPITWAIVRGERETGISLMQMDEGCDTGPVFSRKSIPIDDAMTAGELSEALALLAAEVVRTDLARAVSGELSASPQDASQATEAPMLTKDDGAIDWALPVRRVHDHVRGMTPWPGASSRVRGKTLKVLRARVIDEAAHPDEPGRVVCADRSRLEVACGSGVLQIDRAQLEGRKPLDASELVRGRVLSTADVLGS
jgi:methionyl-tRNA formyltransferase